MEGRHKQFERFDAILLLLFFVFCLLIYFKTVSIVSTFGSDKKIYGHFLEVYSYKHETFCHKKITSSPLKKNPP